MNATPARPGVNYSVWESQNETWFAANGIRRSAVVLAAKADAIGGCVGFSNGEPIVDYLLRPAPALDMSNPVVAGFFQDCRNAGFRSDGIQEAIQTTIPALELPRQAYLGWLFTDSTFLTEYRQLQEQHPDLFKAASVPPRPISLPMRNSVAAIPKQYHA